MATDVGSSTESEGYAFEADSPVLSAQTSHAARPPRANAPSSSGGINILDLLALQPPTPSISETVPSTANAAPIAAKQGHFVIPRRKVPPPTTAVDHSATSSGRHSGRRTSDRNPNTRDQEARNDSGRHSFTRSGADSRTHRDRSRERDSYAYRCSARSRQAWRDACDDRRERIDRGYIRGDSRDRADDRRRRSEDSECSRRDSRRDYRPRRVDADYSRRDSRDRDHRRRTSDAEKPRRESLGHNNCSKHPAQQKSDNLPLSPRRKRCEHEFKLPVVVDTETGLTCSCCKQEYLPRKLFSKKARRESRKHTRECMDCLYRPGKELPGNYLQYLVEMRALMRAEES